MCNNRFEWIFNESVSKLTSVNEEIQRGNNQQWNDSSNEKWMKFLDWRIVLIDQPLLAGLWSIRLMDKEEWAPSHPGASLSMYQRERNAPKTRQPGSSSVIALPRLLSSDYILHWRRKIIQLHFVFLSHQCNITSFLHVAIRVFPSIFILLAIKIRLLFQC